MNLDKIFNPSSIAIIGASEEERSVGEGLVKNLLTSQKRFSALILLEKRFFKWTALAKLLILKKALI